MQCLLRLQVAEWQRAGHAQLLHNLLLLLCRRCHFLRLLLRRRLQAKVCISLCPPAAVFLEGCQLGQSRV